MDTEDHLVGEEIAAYVANHWRNDGRGLWPGPVQYVSEIDVQLNVNHDKDRAVSIQQWHLTFDVVTDISNERQRQDDKWGSQRDLTDEKWGVILGEEYGEVCRAVCEHDDAQLRKELIQVAAVAVAWVEALDGNSKG